jgi:hypothetical protein
MEGINNENSSGGKGKITKVAFIIHRDVRDWNFGPPK